MPPPEAQGGHSSRLAAIAQRVEQSGQDARATRPDGMAEGHRAAVDVHLRGIEAELAADRDGLDGEGLVQLHEVDALGAPAGLLPELLHRGHRGHHHERRVEAGHGLAHDPRDGLEAAGLGHIGPHHHEGRGSVVHAGRVARGHGTALLEGRLQAAERFERGVFTRALVRREEHGVALLLGDAARAGSRP